MFQSLKNIKLGFAIIITSLLCACTPDDLELPPLILSPIATVVLEGHDLDINLTVVNGPDSVSCFNGAVVLSAEEGSATYSGTINHSLLSLGANTVVCTASNSVGSFDMAAGTIFVVENGAVPVITGVSSVTINDADGAIDVALIASANNVEGATYSLASSSSLPDGLSINSSTGNLVGTIDVVSQQVFNIAVTATTVAGSGDTGSIMITINNTGGN